MKRRFPIVFNGMQTVFAFAIEEIVIVHVISYITLFIIEYPSVNIDNAIRKRKKSRNKQVEIIKIGPENETRNALLENDPSNKYKFQLVDSAHAI